MFGCQTYYKIQFSMCYHRVPGIAPCKKNNTFPEIIHYGKMFIPIDLYNVIEDIPDQFILLYFFVKQVDHLLNITAVSYIIFYHGYKSLMLNFLIESPNGTRIHNNIAVNASVIPQY